MQGWDTLPPARAAPPAPPPRRTTWRGTCRRAGRQQALSAAPALRFNEKDQLQHLWAARQTGGAVTRLPCHRRASANGFVKACRPGLGWAMNPAPLVREHLASGRLLELAPGTPLDVRLNWQCARLAAPALAPLTQALKAALRHLIS